ncbi:MAG: hypothetical protein R3D63_05210 [Paracoccaceae bacterium]
MSHGRRSQPPASPDHTGPSGAPDLVTPDLATLDRLLALAGPAGARELMARLQEDLAAVAAALPVAAAAGDRLALRRHSHVLIAVAGSVGDLALSEAARALNLVAHAPDPPPAPLLRRVEQGLATLRAALAARAAPQGDAP